MEDKKEEQLSFGGTSAPYNTIELYLKRCKSCFRVVFLDVETCPSCGSTEFENIDKIEGD